VSTVGPDQWLTVQEVAAMLKVNEETVRRWIRSGELPVLDLGGPKTGYRIRRADLDQFIAARYGKKAAA
jgi:excisionase family DNA binding protein